MSKLDEEIQAANAQRAQECHNSAIEHMAELERNRIADAKAMRGDPLIEALNARRRAQKAQALKWPEAPKVLPMLIRQM